MSRAFVTAILFPFLLLTIRAQVPQTSVPLAGESAAVTPSPFEVAQGLAAKGRLDQALAQLDQLTAQSPEPAGVERLRGMIFYQKERFPEAIEAFARAAAQDPTDRESIEMRGVSLFRLGRFGEALPLLEKARAAVDRTNIDPEYVLGLCYADLQRYDDARHAFAAQYNFAPDSAEAHLLAGRLFFRREMTEEAGFQVRKALEINPTLPLAHQLLGEIALAKADPPEAIHELEAERKLNPLNGALYERLGDAYLRNGQYPEAQQALNRAILLEPGATAPYILLGQTFLKLKNPIQALQYLDHAVKMDPSNHITHNLLGQAYKATGQMADANREFKMGVDLQNGHTPQPEGK
jgi:tetratricopeptide (TPR) repeat protein